MIRKLNELVMTWAIILVVYMLGKRDWGLSATDLGQFATLTIKVLKPLVSDRGKADLEEMAQIFAGLRSAG